MLQLFDSFFSEFGGKLFYLFTFCSGTFFC
jgi:hypothetical protein